MDNGILIESNNQEVLNETKEIIIKICDELWEKEVVNNSIKNMLHVKHAIAICNVIDILQNGIKEL